jgi:hypothetical protein
LDSGSTPADMSVRLIVGFKDHDSKLMQLTNMRVSDMLLLIV